MPSSATEASRTALKNKNSLLPGLGTPSSSQLPYRANLINNGEQIVNGLRNYDHLQVNDAPFRKEDHIMKGMTSSFSVKHHRQDPMLKGQGTYFNDTFFPGKNPQNGVSVNGLSARTDSGILVIEDGIQSHQALRNKDKNVLLNAKTQGNLIGMTAMSVLDTAAYKGNTLSLADKVYQNDEIGKVHYRESNGISERKSGAQMTHSKTKFPKEVFNINIKKRFYG